MGCDHRHDDDEQPEWRIVGAMPRAHKRGCRCAACVRLAQHFDPTNADIEDVRRRLYGND